MKKLSLLLLFILSAGFSAFSLSISSEAEVVQGGVITVYIKGLDDSGTAELEFSNGGGGATGGEAGTEVYSRTEAFRTVVGVRTVDIALLGVPSTLSPGSYAITAVDEDGERAFCTVKVVRGEFVSEDIALSRSMTELRKSDDVRKAEQWRNLLVILKTVDTAHIYETGALELPLTDYIRLSSFYGDRRRFVYDDGTSARSIHNGIDYSAEPGTPVFAAGAGRVVFSGERIISGNTIVIEHLPGVYSMYYHMNSLAAAEGDLLDAGAPVGTVGATGLATGAHLHWEVRAAGVAVDPKPLMAGGIIDKDFILSNIEEQ